jgi:hypothetical protein
MQQVLDSLLLNEDVINLKGILGQDPLFTQINQQVPLLINELNAMMTMAMPVLDLNQAAVADANRWIATLQGHRDKICQYEITLRTFEYHVDRYWSIAYNMCMVQPQIEGLRSNEHKKAYIEQVFKDLIEMKNYVSISLKKLQIISDNIQQAYYSFSAQQKNVQLLATVHRSYGTPN